jgi:hypothetical protein
MALPDVPDVVRVELFYNADADTKALTRHYFGYTGGAPSGADAVTLAGEILAIAATAFAPMMNVNSALTDCQVTDLSSMTGGQGGAAGITAGSRAGGQIPPGAALVISHLIDRRYRGGKPRTYMPWGVSSDITSGGLWSLDFVADALAAWETFTSNVEGQTGGSTVMGVLKNVSYYEGYTLGPASPGGYRKRIPTPRVEPIVDDVNSSAAKLLIGSQRRRNRDA